MNFTNNNHLQYSIGGREFGYREDVTEKYKVKVGTIDYDHYLKSNWLDEQYRTADLIYKDFGKDFVVMFSGGTDSEIVLRAFKKIGITPRAAFIRFSNDYNLQDYIIADEIAKSLDVKLEVFDFDIVNFHRNGKSAIYAKELQCSQLAYLSVYYHIAKLAVPAVMGGEMLLKRSVSKNGSRWFYCFRENEDASAMRFSNKYHIPLVNEWFSYTPEMMLYYLENSTIRSLITERYNGKLASVSTKNKVLKSLMPELVKKIKTTGFEKLLGFNGESYAQLSTLMPKRLEPSLDGIYIDELYKQLLGDKYVGYEIKQ